MKSAGGKEKIRVGERKRLGGEKGTTARKKKKEGDCKRVVSQRERKKPKIRMRG